MLRLSGTVTVLSYVGAHEVAFGRAEVFSPFGVRLVAASAAVLSASDRDAVVSCLASVWLPRVPVQQGSVHEPLLRSPAQD